MGRKRREGARLEMTSLMDVMFLVLVFFIYCIFDMSVLHGTKVDLPNAPGGLEKGERVVVTILRDGHLEFNGKPQSREEIVNRLSSLKRVNMLPVLVISGDRSAALGTGVELMAALKKAGIDKVTFRVTGEK